MSSSMSFLPSSESEDESFDNIRGMKPYMYEPTKSKTNIEYEEIFSANECSDDMMSALQLLVYATLRGVSVENVCPCKQV